MGTCKGGHLNLDHVIWFEWSAGELIVCDDHLDHASHFEDPDGEIYKKVCTIVGVVPTMNENEKEQMK